MIFDYFSSDEKIKKQAHELSRASTGIPALDAVLDDLRMGDNVVWKVSSIKEYKYFARPFAENVLRMGHKIHYMRFASHEQILENKENIIVHQLDAKYGFEKFATEVHRIIRDAGFEAFYVFDSLSDLLDAWATDYMIANFFKVTCPFLFDMETIAYFAVIRDAHSIKTIARIRQTTQLLIDLFVYHEHIHLHPLKVWQRHSPTMFLPHIEKHYSFSPIANSYDATNLLYPLYESGSNKAEKYIDHWHNLFLRAAELAALPDYNLDNIREKDDMHLTLCRHLIGNDERFLTLAHNTFSFNHLLNIKSRIIGSGLLGGKAVGMLLARAILEKDQEFPWCEHLEKHDSFFIGSNVYFSFIIMNNLWPYLMAQKNEENFFSAAEVLREKIPLGDFPEETVEELRKMLEYYGQYPIIVRSSSLLEDGFGNAFAGKYDSFFLVNQGDPDIRFAKLIEAIKKIYVSTMSEDALTYRRMRGLEDREEQMAILIQRVSGSYRGDYYFPDLAGVAISYNTFGWDKDMDPTAGMVRLVLGLGTRAVDRVEGDYPRIITLDKPFKSRYSDNESNRRFSQHYIDVLNIKKNQFETILLKNFYENNNSSVNADKENHEKQSYINMSRYAQIDQEIVNTLKKRNATQTEAWLLTFSPLLKNTNFINLVRKMLTTLSQAYNYPVDVEFTINFDHDEKLLISPVQCRPLQTKGRRRRKNLKITSFPQKENFLISHGNFMGGNIVEAVKLLIFIDPYEYSQLNQSDKYSVARAIGQINRNKIDRDNMTAMLIGPGRWGTTTPSLGVPVKFSEINNIAILIEMAFSVGELMPDLSYGSHFFMDLVETDIFYLALFPEADNNYFNNKWLQSLSNDLTQFAPDYLSLQHVLKVHFFKEGDLIFKSDIISQQVQCFPS